jgi:hypothetical protein
VLGDARHRFRYLENVAPHSAGSSCTIVSLGAAKGFIKMAEEPIQPRGQNLPAFILSLIAGLWMLGTGGMTGGLGMGGMMGGPAGGGYSQ